MRLCKIILFIIFPVVLLAEPLFNPVHIIPTIPDTQTISINSCSFVRDRIEEQKFLAVNTSFFSSGVSDRIEIIRESDPRHGSWDFLVLANDKHYFFTKSYDMFIIEPYTLFLIINAGQGWKTINGAWPIFNQYNIELLKIILTESRSGRIVEHGDPTYYYIQENKYSDEFIKTLKMELIFNYCFQKLWI